MNVQIEKDIPIPGGLKGRVNLGVIPLGEMQVGDSIRVDCAPEDIRRVIASLRIRAHRYASQHPGWKFTASQKGGVIRLWRIE